MRSLESCIQSGRDNMGALRLFAAALVVFGHSYVLAGPGIISQDPIYRLLGHTYSHLAGVMIFFTISGLLITLAWQRNPDIRYYLRSRALRILPALMTCVVLCALLIGPLSSTLPVSDYLRAPQTWDYIWGNSSLLNLQWHLPGVFVGNAGSNMVNGSLWTLPVEAVLYLVVAALGVIGALQRSIWTANVVILIIAGIFLYDPLRAMSGMALEPALVAFFSFGALCCINRHWLPISGWILLAIGVLSWGLRQSAIFPFLLALSIAYGTLWFAYIPRLPMIRFGDLSYGTYLWGFPLQQLLIAGFGWQNPLLIFGASLPLTLLAAALSWRFIEQPALRWKTQRATKTG